MRERESFDYDATQIHRLLETIWRMQNVEDRKLILQESLFKSKET